MTQLSYTPSCSNTSYTYTPLSVFNSLSINNTCTPSTFIHSYYHNNKHIYSFTPSQICSHSSQSQERATIMSQSKLISQSPAADDSSFDGSATGAGEIMLFGVRVKIDPMRKSVSMNNLSQYEHPPMRESSNNNLNVTAVAAGANTGYASADDAVRNQSGGSKERKRGIPWTEDEHKLFLLGLQKVGKGDWRGISRNFVKTRTPTQVASHAQKYFLRRSNLNRRRRRSSLFDITTDSVAAMSTEEQVNEINKDQTVVPPAIASSEQMMNLNNGDQVNVGSTLANPSTRMDVNQNQKYETDLNLSLSYNPNQSSAYQVISGFKNGDSMISVN
ncbi:hypothetical protein QVD17_38885 [Tagetes erecta]|uniref:Uncharacterized protein n=1 Tax=Tagetes erecta TaxID=13708 RepID=A0AAD8JP99_TARER|nr:hypothetical protein QVD17_38885 [Tagetes erecta]